jgi:hypothetical protein
MLECAEKKKKIFFNQSSCSHQASASCKTEVRAADAADNADVEIPSRSHASPLVYNDRKMFALVISALIGILTDHLHKAKIDFF